MSETDETRDAGERSAATDQTDQPPRAPEVADGDGAYAGEPQGAADAQLAERRPADDSADAETRAVVEAILFATERPISAAKIAQVAELPSRRVVKDAIESLNRAYESDGRVFRIESIAGGYQMLTVEQYHDVVSRLVKVKSDSRLSKAALETLSIIAYRQPILRADVESIRGVASGEMIRKLMEKNLVKITGRAEIIGRPMLYGTTQTFLEVFGLSDIADLPHIEELRIASPPPPRDDEKDDAQTPDDAPARPQAPAPGEEPRSHDAQATEERQARQGQAQQDQPSPDAEPDPDA